MPPYIPIWRWCSFRSLISASETTVVNLADTGKDRWFRKLFTLFLFVNTSPVISHTVRTKSWLGCQFYIFVKINWEFYFFPLLLIIVTIKFFELSFHELRLCRNYACISLILVVLSNFLIHWNTIGLPK